MPGLCDLHVGPAGVHLPGQGVGVPAWDVVCCLQPTASGVPAPGAAADMTFVLYSQPPSSLPPCSLLPTHLVGSRPCSRRYSFPVLLMRSRVGRNLLAGLTFPPGASQAAAPWESALTSLRAGPALLWATSHFLSHSPSHVLARAHSFSLLREPWGVGPGLLSRGQLGAWVVSMTRGH